MAITKPTGDRVMHAHTPPFTKPEAAYDSRRLYEETSAIAAAQDAKLDPISDLEAKVRTALSHLHHAQLLLKEAFPEPRARTPKWSPQWLAENSRVIDREEYGTKSESAHLASFSPNESQGVDASQLGEFLRNEDLKGFGIGDVPHEPPCVTDPSHPLHHVTLNGPEDRL